MFSILLASIFLGFSPLLPETGGASLPAHYKKWLEEEVGYIITPRERDVLLKLQTDRERDLFIEAFWKQRNPNPLAEKNEFKDEHYRRLEYANRNLGRGASVPGWKTDRGRIYIKLGRPISVQTYENLSDVCPAIVWNYEGMSHLGIPDSFSLIFFKKHRVGDYRLYSPSTDGIESLITDYSLSPDSSAYAALTEEAPALARVALSLVPGESRLGETSSPASDRLLADINIAPQRAIKDAYAEKFLLYENIVGVDYSANYIDNTALVSVLKDSAGVFFVNYNLELDRFSVNQDGEKYLTRLALTGRVTDDQGKTVYQYDRTIPVELDQQHFDLIKAQRFSFEDLFPLIEGKYHFNLLVKNEASKEFTSIEREILIPAPSIFGMSQLILAYKATRDNATDKQKAFQAGETTLYPSLRLDFTPSDTLHLFFQIFGLTEELKKEGSLRYIFFRDEKEFKVQKKTLNISPPRDFFLEDFSLADFPPGYYRVEVSLCDQNGNAVLREESPFSVSPASALPRPWLTATLHLPSSDPGYIYIQGRQWESKGNLKKARGLLEMAYKAKPLSLQFALSYANILSTFKENETIVAILTPFMANKEYEVLELLGRAYQAQGEYQKAILLYNENLTHFGLNFIILNLIGECNFQAGNKEEAIRSWELSIKTNPNQKELRQFLNSIKAERN